LRLSFGRFGGYPSPWIYLDVTAPGFVVALFQQMAFLAAVLGGFSAAFLGALLVTSPEKRIGTAAVAATAFSAAAFIAVTLGGTVISLVALQGGVTDFGGLPSAAARAQHVTGWLFVLGMYALLLGIGLSGWTRSEATGWCTTAAAVLGTVASTLALAVVWS
jgi:hypothetical protein